MKKREKLIATYSFPSGRVMSAEEFFAKPYEVLYENNSDLPERAAQVFRNISVSQQCRYNYELTKERKVRLLKELEEINVALAEQGGKDK